VGTRLKFGVNWASTPYATIMMCWMKVWLNASQF